MQQFYECGEFGFVKSLLDQLVGPYSLCFQYKYLGFKFSFSNYHIIIKNKLIKKERIIFKFPNDL